MNALLKENKYLLLKKIIFKEMLFVNNTSTHIRIRINHILEAILVAILVANFRGNFEFHSTISFRIFYSNSSSSNRIISKTHKTSFT